MAEAIRDQNHVTTLICSYEGVPMVAQIENATGYLKINIAYTSLGTPTFNPDIAPRDENHVPIGLAAYSD